MKNICPWAQFKLGVDPLTLGKSGRGAPDPKNKNISIPSSPPDLAPSEFTSGATAFYFSLTVQGRRAETGAARKIRTVRGCTLQFWVFTFGFLFKILLVLLPAVL